MTLTYRPAVWPKHYNPPANPHLVWQARPRKPRL